VIKRKETVAKFAKHETLTRISNFRKAQIEILPSHKERGVLVKIYDLWCIGMLFRKICKFTCSASVTRERGLLAQLLINLRKGNINNKLRNENMLEEKQFNEQPSLFVRGKNFLVNVCELRNLGEGKNLAKHNKSLPPKKRCHAVTGEGKIFYPKGCEK
jgi:hypothetical protein